MKRWIFKVVCLVLFGGVALGKILPQEEFKIYNSIKSSCSNYESVTLRVIVNKWNYDSEEILEKVKSFYCQYELVDELSVYLYDCVSDLEEGKIRTTKVYWND